jgi:hypothetical protein
MRFELSPFRPTAMVDYFLQVKEVNKVAVFWFGIYEKLRYQSKRKKKTKMYLAYN